MKAQVLAGDHQGRLPMSISDDDLNFITCFSLSCAEAEALAAKLQQAVGQARAAENARRFQAKETP